MSEPTAIVPDKGIRPGLNETGSEIAKRLVVKKVAGTLGPDGIALPSADTDKVFGVTMEAIGDDERGDVQVNGQAICTAAGAITEGAEVAPNATAGKVKAAASGDYVLGFARSASTNDGDYIEVELVGPGSGYIKA